MSNQAKASSFQDTTIETPFGEHKIVLRAFPPAQMTLETRAQYLKFVKIDPKKMMGKDQDKMTDEEKADLAEFDSIPAEAMANIKDITVKYMVRSVDGTEDNVLDRIHDMHINDYNFIIEAIDKIDKATSLTDSEKKD